MITNLLWLPVKYGYWRQHELWDGTYVLSDWLDILEQIPEFLKEKNILLEAFLGNGRS